MKKQVFGALLIVALVPVHAFQPIRPHDPVVVAGQELTPHLGAAVEDLFLFAIQDGVWRPVAFQIDEKGPDGSYFSPDDGLLDGNDELVFQPQDGASQAELVQWLDDCQAMVSARIEIRVFDSVTAGERYLYLYRSDTLAPTPAPDWVFYDSDNDRITGNGYEAGFDSQQMILNSLTFFDGQTTTGDLLDREKFRIQGTVPIFGSFSLNEDDPVPTGLFVKSGPIRVIRRVEGEITLFGQTIAAPLERHYYRNSLGSPDGGSIQIPPAITLTSVRVSLDFSDQAIGAVISDPNNASLSVDGNPDANVQTLIEPAQQAGYWTLFNFMGFSLINGGRFENIAPEVRFYFHDDQTGGTADGTTDTGDLVSYGDSGVRFVNPSATEITLAFAIYLDGMGAMTGPDLTDYLNNPLVAAFAVQDFADAYPILLAAWADPEPNTPDIRALVRYINKFGPPAENGP